MIVRIVLIIMFTGVFFACNNPKSQGGGDTMDVQISEEKQAEVDKSNYPEALNKVFEAHGGMERWEQMNNLCYEFGGKNGNETHTISLKDRRVKLETDAWSIGYDGSDVWLLENEVDSYKGNARFYHNLIFYFYAMPFVLGDDGIIYSNVSETVLDGETYKGVKISYGNGVGDSPDDEYILYYNPQTYRMEWLGYTVTYGDGMKSDKWSFIKYSEWTMVSLLSLPKELTWYKVEDGTPTTARNTRKFDKITISEAVLSYEIFSKPPGATIVDK